jgi:hypothetical protein
MSDEHLTFEGDRISGEIAFLVAACKQRHGYPTTAQWDAASEITNLLRSGLVHNLAERVVREIDSHRDGVVKLRIVAVVEHRP